MKTRIIARALALATITTTMLTPIAPAQAQLATIDVKAIAQMAKQVEQASQQLTQLKQQVANQQQMLSKLGSNISPELGSIVQDATSIMKSAQGIGYNAKNVTGQMDQLYPKSMTVDQILSATQNWQNASQQTRIEAMNAQNAIVDSQGRTQNAVNGAVNASQNAAGQTAAVQATNQLLAALSTQLTGLQTLLLTQMRAAQTLEAQNAGIRTAADARMTAGIATSTRQNEIGRGW
jgi:P-type conjugative transfer protein TrbJ